MHPFDDQDIIARLARPRADGGGAGAAQVVVPVAAAGWPADRDRREVPRPSVRMMASPRRGLVVIVAVICIPPPSSAASATSSPPPTRRKFAASDDDGVCSATRRSSATRRWPSGRRSRCSAAPYSVTARLASRSRDTIKRNMAALPAYSLGARPDRAARLHGDRGGWYQPIVSAESGPEHAAVRQDVPDWFAGVAFAAIGIGALVPAAIMSIAAANLWTRNSTCTVTRRRSRWSSKSRPRRSSRPARWLPTVPQSRSTCS